MSDGFIGLARAFAEETDPDSQQPAALALAVSQGLVGLEPASPAFHRRPDLTSPRLTSHPACGDFACATLRCLSFAGGAMGVD